MSYVVGHFQNVSLFSSEYWKNVNWVIAIRKIYVLGNDSFLSVLVANSHLGICSDKGETNHEE